MSTDTNDNNVLDKNKSNILPNSLSAIDNELFTFNITTDIYNIIVDYDNVVIDSESVKFACSKRKLNIKNENINLIILKSKQSLKLLLKNPKIDFKNNQSEFQIKMKKGYLILCISRPFKISVHNDNLVIDSVVENTEEIIESFTTKEKSKLFQMKDNKTLLISEFKNKTFLPYTVDELLNRFDAKKYDTIEELIDKEFTISNDHYKFPIIARFKEAYKLIRKKEHGTRRKALNLGFELMFNFYLNPSIITACKNLEQLNIYLDCLEENELSKFSCFDIVYEVSPAKI